MTPIVNYTFSEEEKKVIYKSNCIYCTNNYKTELEEIEKKIAKNIIYIS